MPPREAIGQIDPHPVFRIAGLSGKSLEGTSFVVLVVLLAIQRRGASDFQGVRQNRSIFRDILRVHPPFWVKRVDIAVILAEFDNFDRLSNLPKEKLLIFPFRRLGDDLSASRDVEFFRRTALTAKRRLVQHDVEAERAQTCRFVAMAGKDTFHLFAVLWIDGATPALLADVFKRLLFRHHPTIAHRGRSVLDLRLGRCCKLVEHRVKLRAVKVFALGRERRQHGDSYSYLSFHADIIPKTAAAYLNGLTTAMPQ